MKVMALVASWALTVSASMGAPVANPILFKERWIDGTQLAEPVIQVQALDRNTFVIRQSIKTNFEAPFLYLIFGREKALLLDTGAGGLQMRPTIDRLMDQWSAANHRRAIPLIVAHSHAHGDHIAGDSEFRSRPGTKVVGLSAEEVAAFFAIKDWPRGLGELNLGGRALTIIPTPGHQSAHIMIYDARLKILFSGDSLYPGRLYVPVNKITDFRTSIDRVAAFAGNHPIRAVLGAHIEMTTAAGRDYPMDAASHPNEHRLELPVESITELKQALRVPLHPGRPRVHNDFIIYPREARAD